MDDKPLDLSRRYVRVTGIRESGLVDFEFSLGEPDMMVELIMPREAFNTFCAHHQVVFLEGPFRPVEQGDEAAGLRWNLRNATRQHRL